MGYSTNGIALYNIVNGLVASTTLAIVYNYDVKEITKYPCASISVKDGDEEELDTQNNLLKTRYLIRVQDQNVSVATIGEQVKYSATFKGKSVSAGSTYTPSFDTADEPFLVSKATVKFASDIAGLGAASTVPVKSMKFNIDKKLTQIFMTATTAVPDATEFNCQHNQEFMVSGDFEMVYDADTYKALAQALTKQAIQLEITGTTLIGATQYNKLTIQLASCVLEDWDRSTANGEIMTQTFGFTALYKLSETKTMLATLQNTRSTQYIG